MSFLKYLNSNIILLRFYFLKKDIKIFLFGYFFNVI